MLTTVLDLESGERNAPSYVVGLRPPEVRAECLDYGLAGLLGSDQSNRVGHGSFRLVVPVDGQPADRRCDVGGALEAATRQYFDFVDRKDADAIIGAGTEDIQAVDEISCRWMRGIDEVGTYIRIQEVASDSWLYLVLPVVRSLARGPLMRPGLDLFGRTLICQARKPA